EEAPRRNEEGNCENESEHRGEDELRNSRGGRRQKDREENNGDADDAKKEHAPGDNQEGDTSPTAQPDELDSDNDHEDVACQEENPNEVKERAERSRNRAGPGGGGETEGQQHGNDADNRKGSADHGDDSGGDDGRGRYAR